jgi:purine-binding chemotaxis protein CheW
MVALADKTKASDLLVFAIDGSRYGLPADDVVELTRAVAIAPLPEAQHVHVLEGIVNYHGELAAAIDLRSRFGHPAKPLSPSEHFIFCRAGRHLLALRADAVQTLTAAPVEALDLISTKPQTSAAGQPLAGVAKMPDGLIFIFDLKTFLSEGDKAVIEQSLQAAGNREREEGTN